MAGPVGGRAHLLGAEPGRPAERGVRRGRGPQEALRAGHVPVPERGGPARRSSARVHRHRRLRALQADDRAQRAARDGLRRVRSPGRAVRGADRPAPARHDRGERRDHAPAAPRARPRSRPAPQRGDDRSRVLPLDAVDLPAALRLLVRRGRRPRPPDRRADPAARSRPGRSGGPISRPANGASSSTRTGSRTSTKRRSTGAPRSGPCSPTRRSRRRDAASGGTTPSTGAR